MKQTEQPKKYDTLIDLARDIPRELVIRMCADVKGGGFSYQCGFEDVQIKQTYGNYPEYVYAFGEEAPTPEQAITNLVEKIRGKILITISEWFGFGSTTLITSTEFTLGT